MNQKNFEYLRDQVKYTGFGEGLETQLKENMQKQVPEFTLKHQGSFGKDETTSVLHFKKSPTSDMYFFNNYQVSLKKDEQTEKLNQSFYIEKNNNITLKEAFNLMHGRAVNKDLTNKEGQLYNAWVQLDFKNADSNGNYKLKQFHQNYGFELEKALAKLPIKELGNEQDKTRLIESLQKGNRQSVTFSENGSEQRRYIEANPQFKSVTVYDEHAKRIRQDLAKENTQSQSQPQQKKQEVKTGMDEDDKTSPKTGKRKGQIISQ
ncbi:MAG: hypothetical protein BGO21_22155 [Dyadobacter sp. 50-39]|uniref:hypothetical protein n=1 Tax=Dyadobacter sp. 50-39 TaxID=1895756 RepID=UPI000963847A|nr:hypothetical protein [Dyadobacter sp. 50-39]OJV19766.1 MAG: hypothetical protein BGO21_22155 [Dyadobacter sp. 50-39]